ncbi:NAD(P)-binding protein [Auricularia subglabra TFB-10046 SS5]|nr:NAD(P)-binding protein [Auricularia subglabra TFB-10046 SS5]
MAPTIILTGASRGIGLAATHFLLADGAQVVTVQRTTSPDLKALAQKYPKTLRIVQGDCTADDVIRRAIQETLQTFGAIDAVVFNAATASGVGYVEKLALAEWQKTFDINVFGVVKFLKEVLPVLKDGAKIVFVSSAASEHGVAAAGSYSASKAALNSLNRTVATEHPNLICVSLHPGPVRTEMQQDFVTQAKNVLPEGTLETLFVKLLEPEEPGRVIANLALRAPAALSGKYLHWNDPAVESI